MRRWWGEYAAGAAMAVDPARTVAVLPTAAHEQHGPHLPLSTDSEIASGLLREVVAHAPRDLDFRILPLQAVGKSNEHVGAPGTLTLPAEVAIALWTEIGLSVARAGVRKMVVVNSQGGNADVIGIVARELRVRAGMLCVKCHWGAFGTPEGMFSMREREFGIHGGDYETSMMLHFRPGLVDMKQAQDFGNSGEGAGLVRPIGPIAYGWIATDVNPAGVAGEAHLATAEKGKATAAHQAAGFIGLLREVAALDLATFGAFGE